MLQFLSRRYTLAAPPHFIDGIATCILDEGDDELDQFPLLQLNDTGHYELHLWKLNHGLSIWVL
jgi:hypothetical protein